MTWRRLSPHPTVRAFVADAWHETSACQINDETRELRVHWPPFRTSRHLVRDASRHSLDVATPEVADQARP
jgi:hypothetical protein